MDKLTELRGKIDVIDHELTHLVCRRLAICVEIGREKRSMSVSLMQPDRIAQIKDSAALIAGQYRISKKITDSLFDFIISASCEIQFLDSKSGAADSMP